jgi:hypothetical protein
MIYDKSNILYNRSENSLKHDKTGLLAVQLSSCPGEEKRREEKSFENRFLGATDGYFFSYKKKKGRLMA